MEKEKKKEDATQNSKHMYKCIQVKLEKCEYHPCLSQHPYSGWDPALEFCKMSPWEETGQSIHSISILFLITAC